MALIYAFSCQSQELLSRAEGFRTNNSPWRLKCCKRRSQTGSREVLPLLKPLTQHGTEPFKHV